MSSDVETEDELNHPDEEVRRRRRNSLSGETLFVRKDSTLRTEDVKHDVEDLPAGFCDQAFSWCTGHIAAWEDISRDQFSVTIVRGGLTNLLFKCSVVGPGTEDMVPQAVLLRIYGSGTDLFFSRILGEICFVLLSERKFGPKLYGVFNEGRLEEWFTLRTLGPGEMREKPSVARNIAKAVAHLHTIEMPFDRNPIIFYNCKKWLAKANELAIQYLPGMVPESEVPVDEDELEALTEKTLTDQDIEWLRELYSYGLPELLDELEADCLDNLVTPVVFCHNDLQAGNIMADSEDTVKLIDFEYGNYNFLAYDIANHFAEMMFDYQSVSEWPYYSLNPDNFPDIAWQKDWVRNYLKERYARLGRTNKVEEYKVNRYVRDINRLVCASHFQWALWSVIQAGASTIDFPYLQFGLQRFKEFLKQRERLPQLLEDIGSGEVPRE